MSGRATKNDKVQRIRSVRLMFRRGVAPQDIVYALVSQFGVSDRQAWRYLEEAKASLRLQSTDLVDELYSDLDRLSELYQKAMEQGDLKRAQGTLEARQKLIKDLMLYGNQQESRTERSFSGTLADAFSDITD